MTRSGLAQAVRDDVVAAPVPGAATVAADAGIEIRSLEVRFGGVRALHNVDLALAQGDILGLIGPNGSGKSTLFNAITGFTTVASGSIRVDGVDLCKLPPSTRSHIGIARTFQTPRIDPDLKVVDAVMCGFYPSALPGMLSSLFGLQHLNGTEKKLKTRCMNLLDRLGLAEIAQMELGALPLGQVRLVDVARAMATGSRYLLLDEPAAGLSKYEQQRLIETIRGLAADGVGILLVEHNFAMIAELCENVVVLNRGRILMRGPIRELRKRPEFIEAYLGNSGVTDSKGGVSASPAPSAVVVAPAETVFECANLSASYGPIQVCNGINFHVAAGELLAFVGPNGAGKSSLLGAISGLVRNTGALSLRGKSIDGLKTRDRVMAGIGFVPETRGNIFAPLTVLENLQIATENVSSVKRAQMLDYLLDLFPILSERMQTVAGMLSGGEQQMLAIAMAVGCEPAVLMLDEPSQGLAPTIYDSLEGVFERLCNNGMGIIMTEQNMPFAARVAHRFLVLTHGRISGHGTKAELADSDRIIQQYFPEDRVETLSA